MYIISGFVLAGLLLGVFLKSEDLSERMARGFLYSIGGFIVGAAIVKVSWYFFHVDVDSPDYSVPHEYIDVRLYDARGRYIGGAYLDYFFPSRGGGPSRVYNYYEIGTAECQSIVDWIDEARMRKAISLRNVVESDEEGFVSAKGVSLQCFRYDGFDRSCYDRFAKSGDVMVALSVHESCVIRSPVGPTKSFLGQR